MTTDYPQTVAINVVVVCGEPRFEIARYSSGLRDGFGWGCAIGPPLASLYRDEDKDDRGAASTGAIRSVVRVRRFISRCDGLPPRTTDRRSRRQAVVTRGKPS